MCQSRRGNVCDSPGRRSSSDMVALAKASAPAKALAVVGLVAVQMVFSTYAILGKELMEGGLNPIAFALLRELGSSVVYLIAIAALHPRRGGGWPRRRDLRRFALCGCCMFGNVFLGIVGLDLTTAALVSLLQPTQPVISTTLCAALGHERLTRLKVAGVLLCVAGATAMTLHGSGGAPTVSGGALVVLAQCVSGASYIVHQRPLLRRGYSPLVVSGVSYVLASSLTFVVGVAYFAAMAPRDRARVEVWEATPFFFVVLSFCVLATTVFNYVVIAWVTGKLGATVVTCGTVLQGIFSCAIEYVVFRRPVAAGVAAGAAAVFAGLLAVVGPAFLVEDERATYVDTRATWASALFESLAEPAAGDDDYRLVEAPPSPVGSPGRPPPSPSRRSPRT
jgi:drug/metabolite transporter (DMT)-like permease